MSDSITIQRSGNLIWGAVSRTFLPTNDNVEVLMPHDGELASSNWPKRYQQIEQIWESLTSKLESVIPGGLGRSNLYLIDLRTTPEDSSAVLHFKTTEDIYDWYVRLDAACQIELVAPKD